MNDYLPILLFYFLAGGFWLGSLCWASCAIVWTPETGAKHPWGWLRWIPVSTAGYLLWHILKA